MQGIRRYQLTICLAVFLLIAVVAGLSSELRKKKVVAKRDDSPIVLREIENESDEPEEEHHGRRHFEGKIYSGVRIGAVDVSGMTPEEADQAISSYLREIGGTEITLGANGIDPVRISLNTFAPYWENKDVLDELLPVMDGANVIESYTREKDLEISGMQLPLEVSFDKQIVMNYLTEMNENEDAVNINIAEGTAMITNTLFDRVLAGEREFTLPAEELLIYDVEADPEGDTETDTEDR